MGEMYCFQSKFFKHDTCKSWRALQEEKHLCDITLASTDGQVEAHKVVLSACSPVFRNLIKRHPHNHPLLYLRGVKYSELVHMLSFMYQGEVNIPQEDLQDFLEVGQDLKLTGLTQENEATSVRNGGAHIKIEPSNIMMDENQDMDEDEEGDGDDDGDEEEEDELDNRNPISEGMVTKSEPEENLDHYKPQSYHNDKEGVDFFYCDKCDYESFKVSDLKRHVAAKHKKERFPCDQCDYKTSTKYFLKRHIKTQHTEGGQPKAKMTIYQCEYCEYSSTRNYNIQKHARSMHKDKIPQKDIEETEYGKSVQDENTFVTVDESNTNAMNIGGVDAEYSTNHVYAQSSRPSVDANLSPSGLDYY